MLRLATWNLGGRTKVADAQWEFLRSLELDAVLVQEAAPSALPSELTAVAEASHRDGRLTAVVSFGLPLERIETVPLGAAMMRPELQVSHPGSFAAAQLTLSDGASITLVSCYGVAQDKHPREKDGYAYTSMNRILSDLTPLLMTERRVVLGGDLNIDPDQIAAKHRPHHALVLDRIAAFGLVATNPVGPENFTRAGAVPWVLDRIFVSADLAPRVVACSVLNGDEKLASRGTGSLSDHHPVVLELHRP